MGKYLRPFFLFLLVFCSKNIYAVPIDLNLNDFTATPDTSIDISSDGLSATFYEDPFFSPVSLENAYMVPLEAGTINFDYVLIVDSALDEDYFDFYLNDTSSPIYTVGGSMGTYSDSLSFDIDPYSGMDTDIAFALHYGWNDFGLGSTLTISNVQILPKQVPEPAPILLILIGSLALLGLRKKQQT